MSLETFVVADVSLSNVAGPTLANLNTGILVGYHNHYPELVKSYTTSSMLTDMVSDGFATTEPLYLMAEKYSSAPVAPAQCCIGRRALAPFQSIQMTCTDGTVGHSYEFIVVSSLGVSTLCSYTNVVAAGASLDSSTLISVGSPDITFGGAVSAAKGALLTFGTQPGVYYALSAIVSSSTAGILTANYEGPAPIDETTTVTIVTPLSPTGDAINGNATVATSATTVGAVLAGDSIVFWKQPGTVYTVFAVTSAHIVLTSPYTGLTDSTSVMSRVCTAATAAAALETQMAALSNIGTPSVSGAVISLARTDGGLTDIQAWLANGFGNIQLEDITADPGIVADLQAIQAFDGGAWYAISLDSNSGAEIQAASVGFIQPTGNGGKIGFFNNSDYKNWGQILDLTVYPATDIFSALDDQSISRVFLQQNNQSLLNYAGAATNGQALGMNPGTYTLAYKTLPGVPADSDQTLPDGTPGTGYLNTMTASDPGTGGKNGNYYKNVAGENWLWPGTAPSGEFFDIVVSIDWLCVNIQGAVVAKMASLPKVPFTDIGIQTLVSALRGVLTLASSTQYQILVPNGVDPTRPIVITAPTAASLTPAQRALRALPGFSWSAGLQGAIQTTVVTGIVTP